MDRKTHIVPDGTPYAYVHRAPSSALPYLVFTHGFPSSSWDWRHQIREFSARGYGIIAPDLLGYGGTDKPADFNEYRAKRMAEHVISIMDHEGVSKAIAIGHDWGSYLLSRIANYFPDRFLGFAFLGLAYSPPNTHFDVKAINAFLKQQLGFEALGYWEFFSEPDAASLLANNFDAMWSLMYPKDPFVWKKHLAPLGAFRAYLTSGEKLEEAPYVTPEDKEAHRSIFIGNGGYGPGMNWYKAVMNNINLEDDKTILPENLKVRKPVLLIMAEREPLGVDQSAIQRTKDNAEDVTVHFVDTGHWIQLEAVEETNRILEGYFSKIMDGAKIET